MFQWIRQFFGTTFPQKVEAEVPVTTLECIHQPVSTLPPMTKDDGYGQLHVELLANGRQRHHYVSGPRRGQVFDETSSGVFLRSPVEPRDRKPKTARS